MLLSSTPLAVHANQLDRIEYKINRELAELYRIAGLIGECSNTVSADYVIVGCGTAGAALAARLSDPDSITGAYTNSVLVLEFGVDLSDSPEILAPGLLSTIPLINDPKFSRFTMSNIFNGIPYVQTEGVMWGGSSGHNGQQAYRATPDIYDQWAAISGNVRWLYNNLLNNVMIPLEHYTPNGTVANPSQRGLSGPIFISQEPVVTSDPVSIAISTASGAPFVADINDATTGPVGVSANQDDVTPPFGSPGSIRSYAGNSLLRGLASEGIPAIVDANGNGLNGRKLKIISNAHANRVVFSPDNTALGVEFFFSSTPDKLITAHANKKVILSAGALYDPAILQRSGVGDAGLLNALGIPVVFANSNVGANLQNHITYAGIISPVTTIVPPAVGNCFLGLPPDPSLRSVQYLYTTVLLLVPLGILEVLNITSGTAMLGLPLQPNSRGTVAIVSADPLRQPAVDFNAFSDGPPTDPTSDAGKVVTDYMLMQDIAADAGGSVLYPTPAQYAGGPDELFAAALATLGYAFHMSGTCSMGTSAANGVIDGNLNVFGVNNLMVVSNASAPIISDANTCFQAYYIGLEAARILQGL